MLTEDQVRDKARDILAFEDTETAKSGVGQLTTFKKLGITGVGINNRPDGWYLPHQATFPAIILETKSEETNLRQPQVAELLKNCSIAHNKYKNVVGILYNGSDIMVYKNEELLQEETNYTTRNIILVCLKGIP